MRISTCFLLLCVLVFACSETGSSGADETSHPQEEPLSGDQLGKAPDGEVPFDPDAVYVQRMYATSTGASGPRFLLDGDRNTFWETRPGAGPSEGVMLYFDPAVEVGSLIAHKAEQRPGISNLEYYVNGVSLGAVPPGNRVEVGEAVHSLFIRITRINGMSSSNRVLEDGFSDFSWMSGDSRVGLSEIELRDASGNPIKVRPLLRLPGKAEASSTLEPDAAYHTDYLFDARPEFGWAEGKEDEGVGEKLTFSFDQRVRITDLRIWNGYQRSDQHFKANARLKSFAFGNGAQTQEFSLKDQQGPQQVTLETPLEGTSFELSVREVYPGKSYPDLLVSELQFFDGERWFSMDTQGKSRRQAALLKEVKGTVLEGLVDHMAEEMRYLGDGQGTVSTSLLLRSDNSFVLYRSEGEQTETISRTVDQVADGNWSIEELGPEKGRIRLFGKLRRVYEQAELYKGNTTSERTRIFSEYLNVSTHQVKGGKLIDELQFRPHPSDLVRMDHYLESHLVELRYATEDNFLKYPFYSECMGCYVRREVAEALQKVEQQLDSKYGSEYRLLFWDCFRPPMYQQEMWDKVQDPRYVANPADGGSSHGKGTAVDVTLASRPDGNKPLDMGTAFDHFGEEAHHGYQGLSEEARKNRELLRSLMESAGFKALDSEWWHYSFPSSYGPFDYDDPCELP